MSLNSNVIAFPVQPVTAPLRRPAALVRAAVAGQPLWRRERDLPGVLRSADALPRPGHALPWLRAEEDRMNIARQEGAAEYDLQQHVALMIAILAESRAAVAPAVAEGPRVRAVARG